MKIRHAIYTGAVALTALIGGCSTFYTMNEKDQAVITKFGKPQAIIVGSQIPGQPDENKVQELATKYPTLSVTSGAGLKVKMPLFDQINKFDDRVLEYDSDPADVVTKDKKHALIDTYARWRIEDPLKFMTTVRTESGAQSRLDDIIYSAVRDEVGQHELVEIVRTSKEPLESGEGQHYAAIKKGRQEMLKDITAQANKAAIEQYGIRIIDVRIKRADLPPENAEAVYKRMIAERTRISKKYISEGEEQATGIRASTDRTCMEITTTAHALAEDIRGQSDAQALKIYAAAYGQDPEFFRFWLTLENYRTAFSGGNKKLVVGTDSEFNRFLTTSRPK